MSEESGDHVLNSLIYIALILNIIFFGYLIIRYPFPYEWHEEPYRPFFTSLIYGTGYGPQEADPQYMRDKASCDYAYQIWEGLYAFNLSNLDTPLIPRLATNFGTWTGNNHTVNLRQNVTFHSGTKFNATAVKFTFDRLLFLTNSTNDNSLNDTIYGTSIVSDLYKWSDGTPILNKTEIIDEYTIKFVLNRPYGPWLSLLTFTASMILDPEITPAVDYICEGMSGATTESISGTGPFKLDYNIADVETKFSRFNDYWGGAAILEMLTFPVIKDPDIRHTALLNYDIHILDDPRSSYYDEMRADKDIILYEAGSGTITQYLGMNNVLYNITWRNAISFAIDYDYMIDNLLNGEAIRLKSPIPNGIMYANDSFDVPTLNLTKARTYMQGMGLGVGFTQDSQWQAANFLTVNYTYNLDNQFQINMLTLLENNLSLIGIDVIDNGLESDPYLDYLSGQSGYNNLSLWFLGWLPDYNDPSNYVNSLMSNISSSNTAQINDPTLEAYMLAALQEINQDIRRQIYRDMQKYIVEELRPWAFGYVGKNYDAYINELKGYPSNSMGYNYFYPCYFGA